MRHRGHERRSRPSGIDPDFADSLEGGPDGGSSHRRQRDHAARRLCRQVQRALNMALGSCGDPILAELFIEDVSPAPGAGHLLARVQIPVAIPVADAVARLHAAAARLRVEAGAAIARRRAPQISFVPASAGGGGE